MHRTLVTFHAHPDDESIITAGTMAKAADDGHRVVLVVATRGELGELIDGVRTQGDELARHRVEETMAAAAILGVARVEFLGYHDSGMAGTPENRAPGCFWTADVDEAAERLATILREEQADVLTYYDDHGGYGHPDHVQVHRVGVRAGELAGTPRLYEATQNRDYLRDLIAMVPPEDRPEQVADLDELDLGVPAELITTTVDVSAYALRKREAMRAHASQIPDDSFFLSLPDELFVATFGTEWFIRRDAPPGTLEDGLFGGLPD